MPSLLAASITVLPCGTCTALPSTSRFSIGLRVVRHDALPVVDVVLELAAKMLDEALDGEGRRVPERTDRAAGDVVGHGVQHVEVFRPALAVLDSIDHPPEPTGALAARRALATRFLEIEIRQTQQAL